MEVLIVFGTKQISYLYGITPSTGDFVHNALYVWPGVGAGFMLPTL